MRSMLLAPLAIGLILLGACEKEKAGETAPPLNAVAPASDGDTSTTTAVSTVVDQSTVVAAGSIAGLGTISGTILPGDGAAPGSEYCLAGCTWKPCSL